MLDVDAARELIGAGLARNDSEWLAPAQALGRVLATPVHSTEDLPSFVNSAMDGFAVPLQGRSAAIGEVFEVHGERAAGDGETSARTGCGIMTGAPVPAGLDAVVPVEQARVLMHDAHGRASRIALTAEAIPGQHLRHPGEDIRCREQALPAPLRLGSQHLFLLAGIGCPAVEVVHRPRLAVFCTGRELVDAEGPLPSGAIRNSNGPYLAATVREAGAQLLRQATLPDEPRALEHAIGEAVDAGAQILMSTGAVSMGRHDFVPEVLRSLGAEIVFHKLRMRPGKPLLFARLPGGALYFGLPGNPVAAAVGFRFFANVALRAMLGLPGERPWHLPLLNPVDKKAGFTLYQKARVVLDAEGRPGVVLLRGQESFKVSPLARANAWAVLPADAESLDAGTAVDVHGLSHWGLHIETESA